MTRPKTSDRNRAGIPPLPEPLAGPTVDSHCHLDLCAAEDGPTVEHALEAARSVGIVKIIQVGCDVPSSRWSAQVAAEHEDIWAAVALHP
ncbi:MAG: TatD family hydrolase, partial [Actinomycetes bacterium]